MTGLDIAAFVVLALLIGMGVGVVVFLGGWPGRVARKNRHPYVQAITIGGWVTLIAGGVGWPFILIWAYAPPGGVPPKETESSENPCDSEKGV